MSFLFPLLLIGGIGFYYWNLRRKGGGSIAAGAALQMNQKWESLLGPGETLVHHATATTVRPEWQVYLYKNFPISRLVFPIHHYQAALTSNGRILLGECNLLGALKNRSVIDRKLLKVLRADVLDKGHVHLLYEKATAVEFESATAHVELPGQKLPVCFTASSAFVKALQPQMN